VREGPAPDEPEAELRDAFAGAAEVVRDINKFSNNVMAQQLFLTLALQAQPGEPATPEGARDTLRRWLVAAPATWARGGDRQRLGPVARHTHQRQRLARLLLQTYDSPVMSELMSSLPISGWTAPAPLTRHRRPRAPEDRHAARRGGVAGYVLTHSGRRLVLVAIVNHPNAVAARPALDALVQWSLRDTPLHADTPRTRTMNLQDPWATGRRADHRQFVPQALLTLRTRDVSGISLGMYSAFTLGVALWLAYGLALGEWPIVLANALTLALAATILVTKIVVDRRKRLQRGA
jgi:uncharacterized protein with PQ loop repeat